MKFRSTKNSIRIRIRKSELLQLDQVGLIEESINFGNNVVLSFALKVVKECNSVKAQLSNNYIQVSLPFLVAKKWIETEQVGIESFMALEKDEQLHILIEKDFPCLDRPDEDKSDTFQDLAAKNEDHC